MKQPNSELVEKQKALQKTFDDLDEERNVLNVKIRNARKVLDEFIKEHNDPVAQQRGWEKHQAWLNRPVVELTPEDRQWLERKKAETEAVMHSMIGNWFADIENGIPIPFLIHFTWVDGEKIGPLNKNEVWKNATLGAVLVKLGVFPSIGEAKRAGKDGPLKEGENRVKLGNSIKRIFMSE